MPTPHRSRRYRRTVARERVALARPAARRACEALLEALAGRSSIRLAVAADEAAMAVTRLRDALDFRALHRS
jgi:hypothetical protein